METDAKGVTQRRDEPHVRQGRSLSEAWGFGNLWGFGTEGPEMSEAV